jgi:hypothetical protein
MSMTNHAPSIMRRVHTYPVIVFALLTGPGCGPEEATRPVPSPGDGKAARAFFAKAPKGFGPDPKVPLGKSIIDVPAQTKARRR